MRFQRLSSRLCIFNIHGDIKEKEWGYTNLGFQKVFTVRDWRGVYIESPLRIFKPKVIFSSTALG
jgi:hypothetical protein